MPHLQLLLNISDLRHGMNAIACGEACQQKRATARRIFWRDMYLSDKRISDFVIAIKSIISSGENHGILVSVSEYWQGVWWWESVVKAGGGVP